MPQTQIDPLLNGRETNSAVVCYSALSHTHTHKH